MADNVSITSGSGTSIATDDVSSVHFQKIKVDGGGDGASTPILAGNGVAASALRVTLASDGTGVVQLAAGTNGIGKLTANSGVDIGDVDIASIAAGNNNIGNVDIVTMPLGAYAASANLVYGVSTDTMSTTSAFTIIAAPTTDLSIHLTSVLVTNEDADTGAVVNIADGATVKWKGYAAKAGGGFASNFPAPLKWTAGTAVTAYCSSTDASVHVSAAGFTA
jgi:hypothetical protein